MSIFSRLGIDLHMREVLRGASVTFVVRVLAGVLTFALHVVLARLLGAEQAGVFFLALTVTMIGSVVGRVGLDNAVLRLVASAAAHARWPAVRGVYRRSVQLTLGASLAAAAILLASANPLAHTVFATPDAAPVLRLMALAIVPMSLFVVHGQLLKGLKRILFAQVTAGMAAPALTLAGIGLLANRLDVLSAAGAYTLGATGAALVGVAWWYRVLPRGQRGVQPVDWNDLLASSQPLFWVSLMRLGMQWTSIILLGVWATSSDVAIFNVAQRTALLTSLVLTSVNSIAAPKFAELHARGERDMLASTARKSTTMMVLLATPALLAFVLFPRFVMALFGPEFVVGAPVLVILVLGQFVNVSAGSVGFVLMMTGAERLVRNTTAVAAVLNVVLNVLLIPVAGPVGAAIATAASVIAWNALASYLLWTRLGIHVLPFRFGRPTHRRTA